MNDIETRQNIFIAALRRTGIEVLALPRAARVLLVVLATVGVGCGLLAAVWPVAKVHKLRPVARVGMRLREPPILSVALATGAKSVDVHAEAPCEIRVDGQVHPIRRGGESLRFASRRGRVFAGPRLRGQRIAVVSAGDGFVRVNGTPYRGSVEVSARPNGRLLVVNRIDLESYVRSVVGAEMPSRWPLDCLVAQAVAARSYALSQWSARRKGAYHLGKSELAYRGLASEHERISRCVAASRGVVLMYGGRVLPAYYHAVCGGHTVPVERVFDVPSIPPLAGVECPYCAGAKFYRWRSDVSKVEAIKRLSHNKESKGDVRWVRIVRFGADSRASYVVVGRRSDTLLFSAQRFRSLMGPDRIRSTCFRAVVGPDTICFYGKGWGHGVGMCQWGARGMAREGKSAAEILAHYYPKSDLAKVY